MKAKLSSKEIQVLRRDNYFFDVMTYFLKWDSEPMNQQ